MHLKTKIVKLDFAGVSSNLRPVMRKGTNRMAGCRSKAVIRAADDAFESSNDHGCRLTIHQVGALRHWHVLMAPGHLLCW